VSTGSSRQERQLDELRSLCASGAVSRAIDLAFEHFADFGLTDELVLVLTDALERTDAPAAVRDRFAALCADRQR
jgi:hypothetical protein